MIGIGRVESDVAYGKSFFESLRREFDMVHMFFEIFVDFERPWLLLDMKS